MNTITKLANMLRETKDVSVSNVPYVVLVGDVGTGKSTIVEKLTGETGRSSDDDESVTKTSEYFWVPDKSLLIADTPGANPLSERLEHNIQIAQAFNYQLVSKIFIIAKADTRRANTIETIEKFLTQFKNLPIGATSLLVTHMDTVKWSPERFLEGCRSQLGISEAVFSGKDTTHEELLSDILKLCGDKYDLKVTCDNFLKLFKIHNSNQKILRFTDKEVDNFNKIRDYFEEEKLQFRDKDLVDLYFEFQAYMTEEITRAQQRMQEEFDWDFLGADGANQAGHIANMVNQLRNVLYDVRVAALFYQNDHGCTDLRKCPHCGRVWAKIEGCDGGTTCGNRPSSSLDIRDSSFSILATFTFRIVKGKFTISKNSQNKEIQARARDNEANGGCGKSITWSQMEKVDVPPEFRISAKVSTDDVIYLPTKNKSLRKKIQEMIDTASDAVKKALS